MIGADDILDVSQMIAEAVRAAVAVNSNALDTMLADDAALDNQNGLPGGGAGLDDSIPSAGGGGGVDGCWSIEYVEEDGVTSITLRNCYYNVGGKTKVEADPGNVPADASGFLCAVFEAGNVSLEAYSTHAALNSAQEDETKYIVPLYKMDGGEVVVDMRNAPQIQVFERTI